MSNDFLGSLKNRLKQNAIHIKTFDEADNLLYLGLNEKYVIFENISVKNYFIETLYRPVINCNSSYEKFVDDINRYFNENTIFNNVNFCNDIRILNLINETKNLKID